MSVERNVYQTSKGGKVFVPLEDKAQIIRCATPRFARILSSPSTGSGTALRPGSGTSSMPDLYRLSPGGGASQQSPGANYCTPDYRVIFADG